jgi:protein-S-isoprenylcysteine O-methyltransferase Ste14
MTYLILILLWMIWCALHSVLVSGGVTQFLRRRFPDVFRYYRLLYNLFAVASLVPVAVYSRSLQGAPLVAWQGAWKALPAVLGAGALSFFWAGARRYDFLQFLGLRQIRGEIGCSVLTTDCSLDTGGVLALVRHPWYSGALLVVWVRPLDLAAILTNLVVCGYLVVGAWLEERKLTAQFGAAYTDYQQRVSMFFPLKALARFLGRT